MNETTKDTRKQRNAEIERGGGMAFPLPIARGDDGCLYDTEEYCPGNGGMTLRDYFAVAALQGMLAYSNQNNQDGDWNNNASAGCVAKAAYNYADAMLKARKE